MNRHLLGGLNPDQFLSEYWQKRPLLVRGAIPDFKDPLSPEELAGLACEPEVESRLVLADNSRWDLRHGPFTDSDFLNLPKNDWTLLVQDVEKHLPSLNDLLEPFRFIPDWRVDDLMISYAATQGSVGPHIDEYDVFLLQGMGRRRWQIGAPSETEEELLSDTDLRILANFSPTQEWVLEPGDMLYLPPRIPHHGVALEPCLGYSLGFRAPSHQELLSGFMDFMLDRVGSHARYRDPPFTLPDNPGEITAAVLEQIKTLLDRYLQTDERAMERWFGRFITEPKHSLAADPAPEAPDILSTHLQQGGHVEHNPGSRFAYMKRGTVTYLYVDGIEFVLEPDTAFLAPLLCQYKVLSTAQLDLVLKHPHAMAILNSLLSQGYLVLYE